MRQQLRRQPAAHAHDTGDLLGRRQQGAQTDDPTLAEPGQVDTIGVGAIRGHRLVDECRGVTAGGDGLIAFDDRAVRA